MSCSHLGKRIAPASTEFDRVGGELTKIVCVVAVPRSVGRAGGRTDEAQKRFYRYRELTMLATNWWLIEKCRINVPERNAS